MLKIKDSVNLKELEKFGFKYCDVSKYDEYLKEELEEEGKERFMSYIYKNKEIYIDEDRSFAHCEYPECMDLDEKEDMLYDLIKADLVEKIEGE